MLANLSACRQCLRASECRECRGRHECDCRTIKERRVKSRRHAAEECRTRPTAIEGLIKSPERYCRSCSALFTSQLTRRSHPSKETLTMSMSDIAGEFGILDLCRRNIFCIRLESKTRFRAFSALSGKFKQMHFRIIVNSLITKIIFI